jgi:transposase-like protein
MEKTTSVVRFRQSDAADDPVTELAREGARRILAEALAAEADAFVAAFAEERLADGRRRVVRHGSGPERAIQTGIGPVEVRRPKVRDRDTGTSGKLRFTSAILPKWARRTKSLDALLPVLYLRGVSTGDFREALAALPGPGRAEPLPGRDHAPDQPVEGGLRGLARARPLGAALRLYLGGRRLPGPARMEPQAECMLVLIGATPEGRKELVGFQAGSRESARDAGASCSSISRRAACRWRPNSPSATARSGSGRRSSRLSR